MPQHSVPRDEKRIVGADRVLAVLVELANYPDGVGLDALAGVVGSPKPTVHRALSSLRKAGLAAQASRGVYTLGDEFIRMAFSNYAARSETANLEPLLRSLSIEYEETVHYAVLEGRDVVYRAKVDPPQGAVKLTSTVGGRNPAYSTAVGKLLLSYLVTTKAELLDWMGGDKFSAKTEFTITDPDALLAELRATRKRGYGVDDQENELGINCVAVPVHRDATFAPVGAISVSALHFRLPLVRLLSTVPSLIAQVEALPALRSAAGVSRLGTG